LGMAVAATARWRNAGIVLKPIMEIPPPFRKMSREIFIIVLILVPVFCDSLFFCSPL